MIKIFFQEEEERLRKEAEEAERRKTEEAEQLEREQKVGFFFLSFPPKF